jgi:hypothetical protein
MDREVFLDRLLRASELCREFATQFVLDSLPSKYAFWVLLNCSYDGNPCRMVRSFSPTTYKNTGSGWDR